MAKLLTATSETPESTTIGDRSEAADVVQLAERGELEIVDAELVVEAVETGVGAGGGATPREREFAVPRGKFTSGFSSHILMRQTHGFREAGGGEREERAYSISYKR